MERLEYEADMISAQGGTAVLIHRRDLLIAQPDFPCTGNIQPRQQSQQSGLAGAGYSHDGNRLTLADFQIDPVEYGEQPFGTGNLFGKLLCFKYGLRGFHAV